MRLTQDEAAGYIAYRAKIDRLSRATDPVKVAAQKLIAEGMTPEDAWLKILTRVQP